ncbi:NAD(P)/FAD-dependent oxidoreductase [Rhodopseudomonas palustris]|uniref:NAD(P)/FAD-dependent oxidoreductase n=1 Tax=Rhodopseudomonas palustris TaxID=1076 RepID=UPI000E5AA669|nr:tryptophan 7-halogenase [Rhodopseudomonas palustris]QLH71476.1 tryptophan 7-halogenase [Rhodopseudomonas palustris]RIA02113.1 dehydrogenase [Rhodopseudomonas palustris]
MGRIAVIGAGVAALAAARSLVLAGRRPLLIAPDREVISRGETLSPAAAALLDRLQWADLLDADSALPSEGRFSVWGDATLRQAAQGEGAWHLDRASFERQMRAKLDNDAIECHPIIVTMLVHHCDGVVLELGDGRVVFADAAIDCSGRAAVSSGAAAGRRRTDRLVAVWRVLDLSDDTEPAAATLIEAVPLGWWYMAPLPGDRMMLGLFTDTDLVPPGAAQDGATWTGLAASTVAIAPRLRSLGLDVLAAREPPQVAPAATVTASRLIEGRILRAGDAAAALDPLGANGLATALWSGMAAAEAALTLTDGEPERADAYERDYLQGIAQHLVSQQAMYAAEPRFADAPFWQRRRAVISSHPQKETLP